MKQRQPARKSVRNTAPKPLQEKQTRSRLSYLIENELEKAELVIAVKAISDKLQDMAEDIAKVEADDLMPMQDSLKTAFGPQVADRFSNVATAKLRELVKFIGDAKGAIGNEVMRLEKVINGEAANDMAMPDANADADMGAPGGDDMGAPGGDDGSEDMGAPAGKDDGSEDMGAPAGKDDGSEDMGAPAGEPSQGDMMNAAGRAKKESASFSRRGRRLMEYKSPDFDTNVSKLCGFHGASGALAFQIRDLIEQGRFDGAERKALGEVLNHLASCSDDHRHWSDPDTKVEVALRAAHVDIRLPEVRTIISKLKKLAHLIGFKHEGMIDEGYMDECDAMPMTVESTGIKRLRESKNPDALVLRTFRSKLKETRNTVRSVQLVAKTFSIDPSDVVAIVREAKEAKIAVKKVQVKKAAKPFEVKKKVSKFAGKLSKADMQESAGSSKADWIKMMERDIKLAEAVPQGSRSPSEMHADRAAAQGAKRQVTGDLKAPSQASQAPTQKTPAQKIPGQQPGQQKPPVGQPFPTKTPFQSKQQPPQQPQTTPAAGGQAGDQAMGQGQAQMAKPTTPVGQSPQKATGTEIPKMPGKTVDTIARVTMMSKPTGFPKPGPSLVNTSATPTQGAPQTESKKFPSRRLMARR